MTSSTPSDAINAQEGSFEWKLPGGTKKSSTWYIEYGTLDADKAPLIVLHGGPGMPYEHMLPFLDLHMQNNIPVIFYDQVGCGRATHYPEEKGKADFWTAELFITELKALIKHLNLKSFDILGHSWGGMLAATFATLQPVGLRKLVIGSAPADMQTWYKTQQELMKKLPEEACGVLETGIAERTFESKEYNAANDVYYAHHLYRGKNFPKEVMTAFDGMMKDATVMTTLNGPCEFLPLGTLSSFNIVADIHKINVPTLLLNGRYDTAQDIVVLPFFQKIQHIKWVQFAESAHLWFFEERERAMKIIEAFLAE